MKGAHRGDGQPDVVLLRAATFTDPDSWEPGGSDPLEIKGQGAASVLTSGANTNSFVVNLTDAAERAVTLRDPQIRVPAMFPDNRQRAAEKRQPARTGGDPQRQPWVQRVGIRRGRQHVARGSRAPRTCA